MTPNEIIILLILIAIVVAIICFLVVFCIEHFSKLSIYDRERIQINFQQDSVKGQDILIVKETKGKKNDKEATKYFTISAKDLLEVLAEVELKHQRKMAAREKAKEEAKEEKNMTKIV